ncbi:MAG: rod-binding protein [Nitrospiria bacterium]
MHKIDPQAAGAQVFRDVNHTKSLQSTAARLEKKPEDPAARRAELEKGAKAFESYFVQSLLKEMRKSIQQSQSGFAQSGFTGGGSGYGGAFYQSMFDEAISKEIAEMGGMGLARSLIKNLSKNLKVLGKSTDKISVGTGEHHENSR